MRHGCGFAIQPRVVFEPRSHPCLIPHAACLGRGSTLTRPRRIRTIESSFALSPMRRALLPIFALMLAVPLAQGEGPSDETRFTLRHEMLRMINHDRAAYGLRPVELDPETSTIADSYCRQQ